MTLALLAEEPSWPGTVSAISAALGTLTAVIALIAAVASWRAAKKAGDAAAALTAIENHRWHADLTPEFEVTCQATTDSLATLRVAFVGPAGLDRLDKMSITIRDDIRGRKPHTQGGPSAEEIAQQIWGPYRFVPGVDEADDTGRTVPPVKLLLGDWRPYSLEHTGNPRWTTIGDWATDHWDKPVRLTLDCYREGYERWTVPVEIDVTEPDKTVWSPEKKPEGEPSAQASSESTA